MTLRTFRLIEPYRLLFKILWNRPYGRGVSVGKSSVIFRRLLSVQKFVTQTFVM